MLIFQFTFQRLIPDESEQKIIKDVISLRHKGKSLRSIANTVSHEAVKVSHMTVNRIIQQEMGE